MTFKELQNKLKEANHPLGEHKWNFYDDYCQIAILPGIEVEHGGMHYEIFTTDDNNVFIELHFENTKDKNKTEAFYSLIESLEKQNSDLQVVEWKLEENEVLKKLRHKRGLEVEQLKKDDDRRNFVLTIIEFYNIVHKDIERFYLKKYTKEPLLFYLQQMGEQSAIKFFEIINRLFDYLKITENDKRIVYWARNDKRSINLKAKNHYFFAFDIDYKRKYGKPFAFLLPADFENKNCPEDIFKDSTKLCLSENANDFEQYESKFFETVKEFLVGASRTDQTNNEVFKQAVFDKSFRNKMFQIAFKTNKTYFKEQETMSKFPLNQILYGPPGTGKTYKTIALAVQIADNLSQLEFEEKYPDSKRTELRKRYQKLAEQGQIRFVTFHQSMSYEDFIEGIKPVTDEGQVSYDMKPGIFKEIVELAKSQGAVKSLDDAIKKLKKYLEENESIELKTKRGVNFTVTYRGGTTFRVRSERSKAEESRDFPVGIENIKKLYTGQTENIYNYSYTWGILEYLKKKYNITQAKKKKNFVLIIDEINRGNIANIFGELITLIEQDKRAGAEEAIIVQLPYSKEPFSVPDNLYIIGTMNTADRSVEALDTALRRRFTFIEMPPMPELLKDEKGYDITVEGINLRELLVAINQRIEVLLDKDHKIGHAYFMNISTLEELKQVFENKIIPLLEEYFYSDFGKIGLVLGSDFVEVKSAEKINFAQFAYDELELDELQEKGIYKITPQTQWTAGSFKKIYK